MLKFKWWQSSKNNPTPTTWRVLTCSWSYPPNKNGSQRSDGDHMSLRCGASLVIWSMHLETPMIKYDRCNLLWKKSEGIIFHHHHHHHHPHSEIPTKPSISRRFKPSISIQLTTPPRCGFPADAQSHHRKLRLLDLHNKFLSWNLQVWRRDTLPKFNMFAPEKKMLGRLLSFWNDTLF